MPSPSPESQDRYEKQRQIRELFEVVCRFPTQQALPILEGMRTAAVELELGVAVCAKWGRLDLLQQLAQWKVDLGAGEPAPGKPAEDETPLLSAIMMNQTECALFLMQKGARLDTALPSHAGRREGKTPLSTALMHAHPHVIEALLQEGQGARPSLSAIALGQSSPALLERALSEFDHTYRSETNRPLRTRERERLVLLSDIAKKWYAEVNLALAPGEAIEGTLSSNWMLDWIDWAQSAQDSRPLPQPLHAQHDNRSARSPRLTPLSMSRVFDWCWLDALSQKSEIKNPLRSLTLALDVAASESHPKQGLGLAAQLFVGHEHQYVAWRWAASADRLEDLGSCFDGLRAQKEEPEPSTKDSGGQWVDPWLAGLLGLLARVSGRRRVVNVPLHQSMHELLDRIHQHQQQTHTRNLVSVCAGSCALAEVASEVAARSAAGHGSERENALDLLELAWLSQFVQEALPDGPLKMQWASVADPLQLYVEQTLPDRSGGPLGSMEEAHHAFSRTGSMKPTAPVEQRQAHAQKIALLMGALSHESAKALSALKTLHAGNAAVAMSASSVLGRAEQECPENPQKEASFNRAAGQPKPKNRRL